MVVFQKIIVFSDLIRALVISFLLDVFWNIY